jgi:hypothetical protein
MNYLFCSLWFDSHHILLKCSTVFCFLPLFNTDRGVRNLFSKLKLSNSISVLLQEMLRKTKYMPGTIRISLQ